MTHKALWEDLSDWCPLWLKKRDGKIELRGKTILCSLEESVAFAVANRIDH